MPLHRYVHFWLSTPRYRDQKKLEKGHKESELARMGMVCNRFNILRPSFTQTADSLGMGQRLFCVFSILCETMRGTLRNSARNPGMMSAHHSVHFKSPDYLI